MKIRLAQKQFRVGDFTFNYNQILSTLANAEEQGDDLIVFPELALSGYYHRDLIFSPLFYERISSNLKKILSIRTQVAIILGLPLQENGEFFNSAILIENSRITATYKKRNFPPYENFEEDRFYKKGQQSSLFKFRELAIGIGICHDMWAEVDNYEEEPDLFLIISASPYRQFQPEKRLKQARSWIKKRKIPLIYLNMIGAEDGVTFDGGSFLLDREGKIREKASHFKEEEIQVDLKKIDQYPIRGPFPKPSREELNWEAITFAIKEFVCAHKFERVILGLSGGIDSALVLALAVASLGRENTFALFLPSKITSKISYEIAEEQTKKLEVKMITYPIDEILSSYTKILGTNQIDQRAIENLQARIRANIIMEQAARHSALVLNTTNKSEAAVGYGTIYGDMIGAFAPILDLYKTMVYKLAEFSKTRGFYIPERAYTREPTAELSYGQLDRSELPPYHELDPILASLLGEATNSIKPGKESLCKKIRSLINRSEHKRIQAPIGVKLTTHSLNTNDRRIPLAGLARIEKNYSFRDSKE